MNSTPLSLLQRLQQHAEQAAWERFVQLYSPLLCHWARKLGAAGQEAEDLVQDVFTVLVQKLPEFRYDPQGSFRGWLWTVILNKWRERCRRPSLVVPASGGVVLPDLPTPDPVEQLDEAEYRNYLVQRTLQLLQGEFRPVTRQAFWECAVAGRAAAEVARELAISENAVYLAKGRVLRRLRQELQGLLD